MRSTTVILLGILCLSAFTSATSALGAGVVHDEALNGDLSNDRLNPTLLALSPGANSLLATTGFSSVQDQEYFTIELPVGAQLSRLILQDYQGSNGLVFIGVQSGNSITFAPEDAFEHLGELLGWVHFGPDSGHTDGTDILPDIGLGFGAIGFVPPLDGTFYTFWIQQFDDDTSYQLDFVVAPVPEPGCMLLGLVGLLPLMAQSRRLQLMRLN